MLYCLKVLFIHTMFGCPMTYTQYAHMQNCKHLIKYTLYWMLLVHTLLFLLHKFFVWHLRTKNVANLSVWTKIHLSKQDKNIGVAHMRFRVMREFNLWIFKIKSLGNRMYKSCVSQFRMVQLLVPFSTSSHPRIHFLIPMSINQIFWAFSGVDDFNSSISCSITIRHQK